MAIAKDLMNLRGDGTNYTLAGTETVLKALEVMSEVDISAVMVTDQDQIIGIFTERDYARRCELKGLSTKTALLKDIMTQDLMTVTPDTSIDQCMALMEQYKVRHLPVIEDNAMVGMVSMRDVVYVVLSNRESTIKGLENYILGTGFST